MLLISVVIGLLTNRILVVDKNSRELSLQGKLGENYVLMYDYRYFNIGDYSVVIPMIYDLNKKGLPDFSGNNKEVLQQCIDFISKNTNYNLNNSNPSVLLKSGKGNCQAMALLLHALLKKHGIDGEFHITKDHIYNEVIIDEAKYLVDLAKGEIKIE